MPKHPRDALITANATITDLIKELDRLRSHEFAGGPRELSITITKLEEARHWLEDALAVTDVDDG